MSSVVDVVLAVLVVVITTTCTESRVCLRYRRAGGQHLAQRFVVGAILGRNAPKRMVARAVVVVLLKIEHLEVACLGVVEGHRVAATSDCRIVVGQEGGIVLRIDEC